MEPQIRSNITITKSSISEAELDDISYYAGLSWEESAGNVEKLRQMIWHKEYHLKKSKQVVIANLKEDRDDFK